MKNRSNKLDNFLIITFSFILSLSLVWDPYSQLNIPKFFIFFSILYVIIRRLWKTLTSYEINLNHKPILKREFILYGLLIILPIIVAIIAYYPGYGTIDTINQWRETQTNHYFNWHPALETLLFLKIPSLIYNDYISATIYQNIFIFSILIYFCYFLRKYFFNWQMTTIILQLLTFNPIFFRYSVTLWKDLPYSWCLFLSTIFLFEISMSKGTWLKKASHKMFFILSMIGILILRHNGIVPFIITFIIMIFSYPKSRRFLISAFAIIIVSFLLTTGPIFKFLKINNETGGKSEMMGLVLGQISTYFNSGVYFTDEEITVLNEITDIRIWRMYYNPINFNDIKYLSPYYTWNLSQRIDKVWNIYVDKSLKNPDLFIRSFLNMTSPIWKIRKYYYGADYRSKNYIAFDFQNRLPIISNKVFNRLTIYNNQITNTPYRLLFIDFASGLLLILLALCITISKFHFDFSKITPFIPTLTNSIVIMFLITGEEVRFVYPQLICAIPLLIYSFYKFPEKGEEK